MRALLLLIPLLLGLGCMTTPDANADAAGRIRRVGEMRSYGAAAEFDDAGSGAGQDAGLAASPARFAAAPAAQAPLPPSEASAVSGSPDSASIPREVVYSAHLRIVVVALEEAQRAVRSLAERAGGWLQESTARSIRIRVPADRFDSTVEAISDLGEVVDRSIMASDVTESILDLDIRLENARKTRDRLLAHLAESRKIGDTLKIEAEVARVSETIEQIEGKLRFMRSQIAMSSIDVLWSAALPLESAKVPSLAVPFRWIDELGDGLVAGQVEPTTRTPGLFERRLRFDAPKDFIRYYASRDRVEALSADGIHLKVRRHANHDSGPLGFWRDLARERLVRSRAVAFTDERALDGEGALLVGTREIAGQSLGYLLVLKRTNRHVYSFEAWGPREAFDAHRAAIEASAKTLAR